MCRFYQKLIPLFNISTNNKSSSIFIKLIKMICNFLSICLYSKIALSKCNHFFSRISVLHNQIASIYCKFIIFYRLACSTCFHDFADLSKILCYFMSTILTSNHCSINDLLKVSPLRIVKYRSKFPCTLILASIFSNIINISINISNFLYSFSFKFGMSLPLISFYSS